jgi:heme/copper-type cytochrome/quinol oxidase subunit 2
MFKKLGIRCWVMGCGFISTTYYLLPIIFLLPTASFAQCAMCRASLESEGNVQKAEAVNDGIVYLMAVPYVIVAVIAVVIYRMFKKKKDA